MSYNLTLTDGTAVTTVEDGHVDLTTLSINLIGKNYAGYGRLLNENFIYLLENFSSSVSPNNPVAGQLWWDKQNNRMNVYLKSTAYTGWKVLSSSQTGPTPPAGGQVGDLWFDTLNGRLNVYSGPSNQWIIVGPKDSAGVGVNLLIGDSRPDAFTTHIVGNLIINNKLTAIYSSDNAPFTPTQTSGGLSVINPGVNYTVTAESGMMSSPNSRYGIYAGNLNISSTGQGNGLNLIVNSQNSGILNALSINGTTGLANVAGNPVTSLGIATKGYTDNAIILANLSMKNYVDAGNTIQAGSISTTVNNANVAMKSYVDARFTALNNAGVIQSVTVSGGTTGLSTTGSPIDKNNPSGTITLGGTLNPANGGTGITSYNIGDIAYATDVSTLSKLSIAQAGNILVSTGTAPQWQFANSISVNGAVNLSGGASGSIPYQTNSGTTAFLSGGTAGLFLTTNGTGAPYWSAPTTPGITINDDTSTNAVHYPLFASTTNTTTNTEKTSSSKLTYNPNTGLLSAIGFAGSGAGLTNLPAGQLAGIISSTVINNSGLATTASVNSAITASLAYGLGYSQTWANVSSSRAWNTVYTNTTGKPISVFAHVYEPPYEGPVNETYFMTAYVISPAPTSSNVKVSTSECKVGVPSPGISFIVPPSSQYKIAVVYNPTFGNDDFDAQVYWAELS